MAGRYGARSEGGPRRRNFVSLRGKQKFLLFACPVASRKICYGARPSLKVFQNSAFGFSLKKVRPSSRNFVLLRGKDFVQRSEPNCMSKINPKQEGFGLIFILIGLLIIAFIYLNSLHLLGNTNNNIKENIIGTSSPIEKAKEVKNKYEEKNKDILNYLK